MSELATRQDYLPEVQSDPTGGRLVAWAKAAAAAHSLATSLAATSFVPAAFKGNPGDATAAVLMGDELGLSPLAALRSIFVIHGQPAMYARTMVALAQSHGHQVWTEKSTDTEVVVCGQRRGSEHVERSAWTMARAQKAGYTSNRKYATTSQEMLYAKASAEIARKIAADVLAGVPYSVEDLELEPATETDTQPPAATTKVSRARKPAEPEPIPEPDLEPPGEPAPELPINEPLSAQQMKLIQALFGDLGITESDDKRGYIERLGITVASMRDLNKTDASTVIDALQLALGGDQDA